MYATFLNALQRSVEHVPIIDISVIMVSATFLPPPPPPSLFLFYLLSVYKKTHHITCQACCFGHEKGTP